MLMDQIHGGFVLLGLLRDWSSFSWKILPIDYIMDGVRQRCEDEPLTMLLKIVFKKKEY